MTTAEQLRGARINRAQLARTRIARQVAAAGGAPVVTIATDTLVTMLAEVDAALADAEALHLADTQAGAA